MPRDVVRLGNNSAYLASSIHTQFGDYWLTPFGVVWPDNSNLNLIRQIVALRQLLYVAQYLVLFFSYTASVINPLS